MVLCCDLWSWLQLLLLLVAVYLVYMCWNFRVFTKQGVPMAGTAIPVLGTNLPLFKLGFIEAGRGRVEKYGKTYCEISGRRPVLTTVDADILRQVFIKDHASFHSRMILSGGDPLEDTMLQNVQDYAQWKSLRSTMTPAFTSGKLKRMMKQMNKCAAVYATHLTKEQGKSVEMRDFAGSFTMDVIASLAFGLDVNTKDDRNNPFVQHAVNALDVKLNSKLIFCFLFFPFLKPIVQSFKFGFIDKSAKDFFADISNQVLDSHNKDEGAADFIRLMMNAHEENTEDKKRPMTREEIVSQAVLFFVAGYDTTATTISFLAYNLACHPDEQDKLIEEVQRVLADKEEVSDEDLHQMPYLEMCVSESMRLFPPGLGLNRLAARDVVVKGIHVPKGSIVIAPIYHMHHLAEYYPQPEAFIPERFSPEEKAKRDPILYMPFGAGPRQCLATRLALLEVKIAVCHVLKTHRFVKAPETEVPIKFANNAGLMKAENGIWLRVEKHSSSA